MRDWRNGAGSSEELQLQEYLFDLNGYLVVRDVLARTRWRRSSRR